MSEKTLKTICQDFATIFTHITEILEDHETRIAKLEKPILKNALIQVLVSIGKIEDSEKSATALEEFRKVCEIFGWVDLEDC